MACLSMNTILLPSFCHYVLAGIFPVASQKDSRPPESIRDCGNDSLLSFLGSLWIDSQ